MDEGSPGSNSAPGVALMFTGSYKWGSVLWHTCTSSMKTGSNPHSESYHYPCPLLLQREEGRHAGFLALSYSTVLKMMLIVFSNSNWRKETFSFQNWLDPAKEIKKQIRSKFVIIVFFFQWFWKTFPFGIPRPPKLTKHKLLCLQTVLSFPLLALDTALVSQPVWPLYIWKAASQIPEGWRACSLVGFHHAKGLAGVPGVVSHSLVSQAGRSWWQVGCRAVASYIPLWLQPPQKTSIAEVSWHCEAQGPASLHLPVGRKLLTSTLCPQELRGRCATDPSSLPTCGIMESELFELEGTI